jgi:dTDP-4-dehydrorhamnose 3,5-epimerase-like enzyme
MSERCRFLDLPRVTDVRGSLTFIEGTKHVPFPIKRVYYIYDVPGGEMRGAHAHKALHQLVLAVSGSFEVIIDDGACRKVYRLDRAFRGLYVPPMHWRELLNFTSGAVCLVLASEFYDAEDYIRDYETFQRYVTRGGATGGGGI